MTTRTIFSLFTIVLFAFSSCEKDITPSGNVVEQSHTISDFNSIEISDAFKANITLSAASESIVIEADDNIHEYIEVKKTGDKLHIGLKSNYDIMGTVTLNAEISTAENISGISASGASNITIFNVWEGNTVSLEGSGASYISGALDVTNLDSNLSGASIIDLSGSANTVNADLSGASTFDSYDLEIQDLEIDLSGASNCKLTVNGTLDVEASGASMVKYKGTASITHQNLTGASQIIKID